MSPEGWFCLFCCLLPLSCVLSLLPSRNIFPGKVLRGSWFPAGWELPGSGQERSVNTHTQSPQPANLPWNFCIPRKGAFGWGCQEGRWDLIPWRESSQHFGNAAETSPADVFHGSVSLLPSAPPSWLSCRQWWEQWPLCKGEPRGFPSREGRETELGFCRILQNFTEFFSNSQVTNVALLHLFLGSHCFHSCSINCIDFENSPRKHLFPEPIMVISTYFKCSHSWCFLTLCFET